MNDSDISNSTDNLVDIESLSNEKKIEILISFLSETRKELRNWRERNWNALKYSVIGMISITSISIFKTNCIIQSVAILIIAFLSFLYMKKNSVRYYEARCTSSNIEKALGLSDTNVYISAKIVCEGSNTKYIPFETIIWIIAFLSIVSIYLSK